MAVLYGRAGRLASKTAVSGPGSDGGITVAEVREAAQTALGAAAWWEQEVQYLDPDFEEFIVLTVPALPGRLSALSVFHVDFVWRFCMGA
jgi:hypothetical protein